ncbi:MAG: ACT domain-containing protein [Holdemania massiliensis]
MADPRIIEHPVQIERITYSEPRIILYGANVLHEDAIYPVKDANIPIVIRNTNQPENPGTQIVDHVDPQQEDRSRFVTGIAGKKDFTVITMYRHNASNEVGLLKRALEVLEKYRISVEHVPSGIDNFSIVVSSAAVADSLYEIAAQLKQVCECDDIKVVSNLSLIAVVGRNMALQCGISGQLFQTLGAHQINIRMIAQGSDEINIIVGVENEDFDRAIQVLYAAFAPKRGRKQE